MKKQGFFNSLKLSFINFGRFLKKVWKHPRGKVGVIIIGLIILIAIFAPLLTPYSPYDYNPTQGLQKPSKEHFLGTDKNGIDIMAQLLYGARISLIIGIVTGVSVTLLGSILGIVAGYYGKVASSIIINLINVLLVIPTLPLMILLHKVSSSYVMLIFVFVAFGWPGMARVIRSQVLSIKNMNYVKEAELNGASKRYIMLKHIMPEISHLIIMSCALSCAGFILAEAGLSFIGLGDPTKISWGRILVNAQESAFTSRLWAWILAPGVALFLIVTGFMQIGYALEDIFNPLMKMKSNIAKDYKNVSKQKIEENLISMDDITLEQAKQMVKEDDAYE